MRSISKSAPKKLTRLHPQETLPTPTSGTSGFFRRILHKKLATLRHAQLILVDADGSHVFGESVKTSCDEKTVTTLSATVTFNDIDCYRDITLGGSNGAAEAYLQGRWETDDLCNVIRVFARNRDLVDEMESGWATVTAWLLRCWHTSNKNTKHGSRKNIAAHYDLGNDFFSLFLDKKMMYSSYLYQKGDDYETASTRKLQRICDQLKIISSDHIVEIGTGWGGFAVYAAQTTGCKVTTITISKEQYHAANARVIKQNMENQVTVKLMDYRDLTGQYDKLVSIEMIEAVGHHYLDRYFETIARVLKPKGQALIQAITVEDHRYEQSRKEVDYIKRYIFPGGFLPSVSVISHHAGRQQLVMHDLFDMGYSYAQTLQDWRHLFMSQLDKVRAQGFDERFIRMWEYYLCYCEGGFSERAISVVQAHFRKSA